MLRTLMAVVVGFLAGVAVTIWLTTAGILVLNPSPSVVAQTRPPDHEMPERTAETVRETEGSADRGAGPAPAASLEPTPSSEELGIGLPIPGLERTALIDTFEEQRGEGRKHEAIDIIAPRNTPVVAVAAGRIAKLFLSKPGGLTIYQFDADERYCFYYAHLDHYERGIAEGIEVRKGQIIGYVGSTGNANANNPHLHFAVFQLGPDKRWWEGEPINPYPALIRAFGR
jgi:murein DD-endopeptidase MepM/ murein hydrolase activator NlpD